MERNWSPLATIVIPNVCFYFEFFVYLFSAEYWIFAVLIQVNKSEGHLEPVVLRYCEVCAVESWDHCRGKTGRFALDHYLNLSE